MPREIEPASGWENIARTSMHRTQIRVLDHLAQVGTDSPSGMCQKLGEPLGNVSYHVKALHKAELLVLEGTEPRRGAVEHFYRLSEEAEAVTRQVPYDLLLWAFRCYANHVVETPEQVGEGLCPHLSEDQVRRVVEALKGAKEPGSDS